MRAVRLPRRRGRPRTRPKRLLGDRAYSTPAIRGHCRRRRIEAVIPQRADEKRRRKRGRPLAFDPAAYRKRNAAERCVGWLKGCRGVGTRSEKLAVNFLAHDQARLRPAPAAAPPAVRQDLAPDPDQQPARADHPWALLLQRLAAGMRA
jgi:transposase